MYTVYSMFTLTYSQHVQSDCSSSTYQTQDRSDSHGFLLFLWFFLSPFNSAIVHILRNFLLCGPAKRELCSSSFKHSTFTKFQTEHSTRSKQSASTKFPSSKQFCIHKVPVSIHQVPNDSAFTKLQSAFTKFQTVCIHQGKTKICIHHVPNSLHSPR